MRCGTARYVHDWTTAACPEVYRPDDLEVATTELLRAALAGDANAVFTARGNVQRLLQHPAGTCRPLCSSCQALLETNTAVKALDAVLERHGFERVEP